MKKNLQLKPEPKLAGWSLGAVGDGQGGGGAAEGDVT
jgi:hypothetical protein